MPGGVYPVFSLYHYKIVHGYFYMRVPKGLLQIIL